MPCRECLSGYLPGARNVGAVPLPLPAPIYHGADSERRPDLLCGERALREHVPPTRRLVRSDGATALPPPCRSHVRIGSPPSHTQTHACRRVLPTECVRERTVLRPELARAVQCAVAFTNLYEECFAELGSQEGAEGTSAFPDSTPNDGRNEYDEFYDICNRRIHPKTDSDAPHTNNGLSTCVDDPTFAPESTCIDAYDQAQGKGACHQTLSEMGYTCATLPRGYCDRTCNQCAGICPMLGPGQPQGCECDFFGGIANCPQACNGYCVAEVAGVQQIVVQGGLGPTVRPVLGEIQGECPNNKGRHQWFKFMAYKGNSYQVYTELVDGGLTSTYLHLHATDADQTELASSKSWHCNDRNLVPSGPGASCMTWACTATGEYAVRVQQNAGSGAFRVGVMDNGLVQTIAVQEGLAPQLMDVPDHGVYLRSWSMSIATHCDLVYCTFTKDAGTLSERQLTSDGERFLIPIAGISGATYTFSLALRGVDTSASYVKITATPRSAQGGADAFEGNSNMMREISLGSWEATGESHHNYHEFNPDYDMKDYHNYPGRESAATGHWKWVCPAAGEYFIVVTSNCDVPVLDDVEANLDSSTGMPVTGTVSCDTSWTMDLHVEDETTEMTLPIVIIGPPEDAAAGSAAQQVAASQAAVAHPAQTQSLSHMASHPVAEITEQVARDLCQLPVELMCTAGETCVQPSPEILEGCAQMAMAFPQAPTLMPLLPPRNPDLPQLPPLPPATDGHRRMQHGQSSAGASLTHLTAKHVQYQAPNRDVILERHQQEQRHECMRHGLQQHQCPGAIAVAGSGRRRLGDDQEESTDHHGLTWEEEMSIVQAGARVGASIHEHSEQLLDANRRALKAEKELARVRKELEGVKRQRDDLLQQR